MNVDTVGDVDPVDIMDHIGYVDPVENITPVGNVGPVVMWTLWLM